METANWDEYVSRETRDGLDLHVIRPVSGVVYDHSYAMRRVRL